jgi:carboxyl-terminal processing protease
MQPLSNQKFAAVLPTALAKSLAVFLIMQCLPVFADLKCELVPQIMSLYLRNHYQYHVLDAKLKERTVEQFVQKLDPSKTTLMAEDIPKIKADLATVFQSMRQGNCEKLGSINALLVQRSKENEAFVKEFLGPKYQLDKETVWMVDPKKRDYPKTADEKKEVLRKVIHFQMSSYLLSDMKLAEARKNLSHRYELITKRNTDRKLKDELELFIESFCSALDPHSSFLSADSLEDFQISMELSLEGIGASLRSQDGFTVIENLIEGGAAKRSKLLKPKDKILAVAQGKKDKPVSVIDMDLRDVVKLIRGKKGTLVRLTILRQGEKSQTFEVELVRDKINIEEQAAKLTYQTRDIGGKKVKLGVIDLPSFYGGGKKGTRSSSEDIRKLLTKAKKENVQGIVLDLSSNGGGLLSEAVNISGLFINEGAVVATKSTSSQIDVLRDEDKRLEYDGPLVVVVSRLSASASEILAGALKDYKRAVIVGADHTFGKGSVQAVVNLPMDIGGMKVTTGLFFVPGGQSTQLGGVPADVAFPSVLSAEDIGERFQDYALPEQSIPTFVSTTANGAEVGKSWKPITDGWVKSLNEKSSARIAKSDKFAEIRKSIEENKKNAGVIKLADTWKKSAESKQKKDKSKKTKGLKNADSPEKTGEVDPEMVDKDAEEPGAILEEAVNVLADLTTLSGGGTVAKN